MSNAILKYRFPIVLVCLAALCLSLANAGPRRSVGLDDSGNDPKKIVFAFAAANATSVLLVAGERARPHILAISSALFHGQARIGFGRVYLSFPNDDNADADDFEYLSATPVRAPPLFAPLPSSPYM